VPASSGPRVLFVTAGFPVRACVSSNLAPCIHPEKLLDPVVRRRACVLIPTRGRRARREELDRPLGATPVAHEVHLGSAQKPIVRCDSDEHRRGIGGTPCAAWRVDGRDEIRLWDASARRPTPGPVIAPAEKPGEADPCGVDGPSPSRRLRTSAMAAVASARVSGWRLGYSALRAC